MVDAKGRRHGRFPFVIVFLIVMIIACEFYFGTTQIQSTLRGRSSQSSYDNDTLDSMVNETVELLLARISDHDTKDERVTLLERKVASLEAALFSLVRAKNSPPSVRVVKETDLVVDDDVDDSDDPLCVTWKVNMDEWWTHHPEWYVSLENATHYCFSRIQNAAKAAAFRKLYDVQFKTGDCSNVITKPMWSSGWGADFDNVVDGLKYAMESGKPTQMLVTEGAWHYAGKKDASRSVCETKDMYCYFLNLTRCPANPNRINEVDFLASEDMEMQRGMGRWLLEYATRPQTWLRHEVFKFSSKVKLTTPCTAIHVRRSDVVLHEEYARKYRKIADYVNALNKNDKNILLLTDDQNAIEEAQTLHPEFNWMFLDRQRHRGVEGGWENQIPSDDPKLEVIVLLSIFRLVRQCSSLIHTHSKFADVLQGEMEDAMNGMHFRHVNLDANDPNMWNRNNSLSVNISMPFP